MEPNYVYRKGKGWIVYNDPILTTRNGTQFRLELRMPNDGERWDAYHDVYDESILEEYIKDHPNVDDDFWGIWYEGNNIYYKTYITVVPV